MSERDEWYSDAALAKQAAGHDGTWVGLAGLLAPRVPPTDDQRCCRCGIDAREGAGGDGHFCVIHSGRGCEVPEDCGDGCCKREASE